VGIGFATAIQRSRHDDRGYCAGDHRQGFKREKQPRNPGVYREVELRNGFVEPPDDVTPSQEDDRGENQRARGLGVRPKHWQNRHSDSESQK
jgi:hypothetical protein